MIIACEKCGTKYRFYESLIVGDIGPSGEFRSPVGEASGKQWKMGFQQQADILKQDIDLWHIETMSDIQEMIAAIHAIKEVSQKPIIASMTYRNVRIITDGTLDNGAKDKIDITPAGSETIDGAASFEISKIYEGISIWSNGTAWIIIQAKAH